MPAVRKPTIHNAGKRSKVLPRISSLLKKPARGGIPAMARVAIKKVRAVAGIFSPNGPHFGVVWSPGGAGVTPPGPRERGGFEKRWGITREKPAGKAPTPGGGEVVA